MSRGKMKKIVLAKLQEIQEGNDKPIWVSGIQMTQLLKSHNPSSIRMALLFLVDDGVIIRQRRKGRGKTGKTGQSSWYTSLIDFPFEVAFSPYDYRSQGQKKTTVK